MQSLYAVRIRVIRSRYPTWKIPWSRIRHVLEKIFGKDNFSLLSREDAEYNEETKRYDAIDFRVKVLKNVDSIEEMKDKVVKFKKRLLTVSYTKIVKEREPEKL